MNEYNLCLVLLFVFSQSAVQGNVYNPLTHVCMRNFAPDYSFELYRELKSNIIDVIAIDDDDVFTEFDVVCFLCIHVCKDRTNQGENKRKSFLFYLLPLSILWKRKYC